MGSKERKIKERELTRQLIIKKSHEILANEGLEALTMRSIAKQIDYSQSKIYEFFSNKDQLCEVLCYDHCNKLLKQLEKIDSSAAADAYLEQLIQQTLEYHRHHPHSDALLTLVCFGPRRFEIPESFKQIEQLFIHALQNLKSPGLRTKKDIEIGLAIIRFIFIGTSQLMNDKHSDRLSPLEVAREAIRLMIRGWKADAF